MKNAGPATYSLLLWEVTPYLGSVAKMPSRLTKPSHAPFTEALPP
jgi:hypothetical protein